MGLSDHRPYHHQSTRHLQRLHQLFSPDLLCFYHGFFELLKAMGGTGCVCCAFSLPGLAIECFSLSLQGRKAASAVSLPRQRVIARMLTSWDAALSLENLPGQRAISFHDVPPARRPGLAIGFPSVLSLPAGKVASRGAWKRSVSLASF